MNSASSIDFLHGIGIKKGNYNYSPIKSNREALLNSNIIGMYVLTEPLRNKAGPIFKFYSYFSWVLPARVSGGNFTHASVILLTNEDTLIRVEYGAYDDKREGDYRGQVHYFRGQDGLRFVQISERELQSYCNDDKYFILQCDIQNVMTLEKLLNKTTVQGSYHTWDREDYNLLSENCQLFVRKAIQVLGAIRKYEISRNRTIMKMRIPFRALNALEDNEKDDYNFIQRIPITGQIYDFRKLYLDSQE